MKRWRSFFVLHSGEVKSQAKMLLYRVYFASRFGCQGVLVQCYSVNWNKMYTWKKSLLLIRDRCGAKQLCGKSESSLLFFAHWGRSSTCTAFIACWGNKFDCSVRISLHWAKKFNLLVLLFLVCQDETNWNCNSWAHNTIDVNYEEAVHLSDSKFQSSHTNYVHRLKST